MEAGELLARYGHASDGVRFYQRAKRQGGEASTGGKTSNNFDQLVADASAQFQRDAKAIAQLEAQVQSSPNEPVHYFKLGLMLTKLGEFSRCFELMKPAVARFPRSSEILLAYALA